MGIPNTKEPETYASYHFKNGRMFFKRGCLKRIKKILVKKKYNVLLQDKRLHLPKINLKSKIKLQPEQKPLVKAVVKEVQRNGAGTCYALAPASSGKTIMGLQVAHELGQPAMVLVWSKEHQKQWLDTIKEWFDSSVKVGGVGGYIKKVSVGDINVCMQQSMYRPANRKLFKDKIGTVLVDEVQTYAAATFHDVLSDIPAANIVGFTVSIDRRDGKKFLIQDCLGKNPAFILSDKDINSRIPANINLVMSKYYNDDYENFGRNPVDLSQDMARNKKRNQLIIDRTVEKTSKKKLVLILVERKYQALYLHWKLRKLGLRVELLVGKTPAKEFEDDWKESWCEFMSSYQDDKAFFKINKLAYEKNLDVVIATAKKGDVGLSIRTLDHVIVTTPTGGNLERFRQQKGRVERTYKEEEVKKFGKKPKPSCDYIWDVRMESLRKKGTNIMRSFNNVRIIKPKNKGN